MKLVYAGVSDPMLLPSLHYLLDVAEAMVLESKQTGDPDKDEAARGTFFDQLYAPDKLAIELNGAGYRAPPPGFDDPAEMELAFDAFMTNPAR